MSSDLVRQAGQALARKQWQMVVNIAQSLIQKDIDPAYGYYLFGMAEKSRRQIQPAFEAFSRAIKIDPVRFDARLERAEIQQRLGQQGEAVASVRQVLLAKIDDPEYLGKAGDILSRAGLHSEAHQNYETAHRLSPDNDALKMKLANTVSKTGNLTKARRLYDELLAKFPEHQRLHYDVSKLSRAQDRRHIDAMFGVLDAADKDDTKNIFLLFALAKELEDQSEWNLSFEYYWRGNEAAKKTANTQGVDPSSDVKTLEAIPTYFTPDNCRSGRKIDHPEATPVFILGLPRSGTTLLEKIVTGHVDVESIDESFFLENAVKSYCGISPQHSLTVDHMGRLAHGRDTAKIVENYFAWSDYRRSGKPFFIEKYPMNFQYLGLIMRHVPDAKILFMQRSPMDVCFALYKQPHFRFAFDLEGLGEYYARFAALAKHWQTVFGAKIHVVQYEDLVENPIETVNSVMGYLELDYLDELLEFHKRNDSSASASSAQVREKLYSRSVGKWKYFETQLEPLKAALLTNGINLS